MKSIKWLLAVIGVMAIVPLSLSAEEKEGVSLTVYNSNLGLVRENRLLDLPKGIGEIKFTDVATGIDATSVHFKSLKDLNVKVLDQNYEFDLVNSDKLLHKHIDKKLMVLTKEKGDIYEGTLMSFDGGQLVLKTKNGLAMINRQNIQDIRFEELPEGLITKPTLMWLIDGKNGGNQLCELSYLTSGIDWRCDYTVVVSSDDKKFNDLSGWVTINNMSGATYKNAQLKLIAGDVHRVTAPIMPGLPRYRGAKGEMAMSPSMGGGFEEKAFFEYHLYTLGRLVTVKNNQIKQEELLTAHNVTVNKIYEFDSQKVKFDKDQKAKVPVKLEFKNSKEFNLGMPLPKGRVRVYKEDSADKNLEFIGEDEINHTPKDEKTRIYLGDAFDVVGERKQTDQKQISMKVYETSFEIKLRNHKNEDIEVVVIEHLWGDWDITAETIDKEACQHTKKDAFTVEWKVKVAKDGEAILKYTARYNQNY